MPFTNIENFSINFLMTQALDYGQRFLYAFIILIIGIYLVRYGLGFIKKLAQRSKIDKTIVSFLLNIIRALAITFVVIAALDKIGIDTTSAAAVIAAAGLAIGLALQNSLSNLAAGIMIIVFKFVRTGDYVSASGVEGTIEEINLFTTHLISKDNTEIIVPNGHVISGNIINYTKKEKRRIDITIGICYKEDLKRIKTIIYDLIVNSGYSFPETVPEVHVTNLGESQIDLLIRVWVSTSEYWPVKYAVFELIKEEMDRHDVNLAFPRLNYSTTGE